jgi:hypothetical protein
LRCGKNKEDCSSDVFYTTEPGVKTSSPSSLYHLTL